MEKARVVILLGMLILLAGSAPMLRGPTGLMWGLVMDQPEEVRKALGNFRTVEYALMDYYWYEGRLPPSLDDLLASRYMAVDARTLVNPYSGRRIAASSDPGFGDLLEKKTPYGMIWSLKLPEPSQSNPTVRGLGGASLSALFDGSPSARRHLELLNPLKLVLVETISPVPEIASRRLTMEEVYRGFSSEDQTMFMRCRYLDDLLHEYFLATGTVPRSLAEVDALGFFMGGRVVNPYTGRAMEMTPLTGPEEIRGGATVVFGNPEDDLDISVECWNPEGRIVYGYLRLIPVELDRKYPGFRSGTPLAPLFPLEGRSVFALH